MHPQGPDIRRLDRTDVAAAHALWSAAGLHFEPDGRDSPDALHRDLAGGRTFLLGFFSGERLVGTALGTEDGRKGWINRVAVEPDHQSSGIGRALIRACEAIFEARGIPVIACLVFADNDASLEMFRRAGYDVRRDIVYLRKSVAPPRTNRT